MTTVRRRNQPHHVASTWEDEAALGGADEAAQNEQTSTIQEEESVSRSGVLLAPHTCTHSNICRGGVTKPFITKQEHVLHSATATTMLVPLDDEEESPLSVDEGSSAKFVFSNDDPVPFHHQGGSPQTQHQKQQPQQLGAAVAVATAVSTRVATGTRVAFSAWNEAIRKYHLGILCFTVLIVWPMGLFSWRSLATTLQSNESSSMLLDYVYQPLVPDSPSAEAYNAMKRNFFGSNTAALVDNNDDSLLLNDFALDDGWRHDPSHPAMYVVLKASSTSDSYSRRSKGTSHLKQQPRSPHRDDHVHEDETFESLTKPDTEPYQQARDFLQSLNRTITSHCFASTALGDSSNECIHPNPAWLHLESYYAMRDRDEQLSWLARTTLASPGGKHVLFKMEYRYDHHGDELRQLVQDFVQQHEVERKSKFMMDEASSVTADYFTAQVTGMSILERDLAQVIVAATPLFSLWVMAATILLVGFVSVTAVGAGGSIMQLWGESRSSSAKGKSRYLVSCLTCAVVLLFTMWTAVCIWSLMVVTSRNQHINNLWAFAVASYLLVATSVNYCVILLECYFREQEQQESFALIISASSGNDQKSATAINKAVRNMLNSLGADILYSSAAMLAIFSCLSCLPLPLFQAVKTASCLAIFAITLVHLTVTPALLHAQCSLFKIAGVERILRSQSSSPSAALLLPQRSFSQSSTGSCVKGDKAVILPAREDQDMPLSPLSIPLRQTDSNANDIFRMRNQYDAISHLFANDPKREVNFVLDEDSVTTKRHRLLDNRFFSVLILAVAFLVFAPVAWYACGIASSSSVSMDLLFPSKIPSFEALRDLTQHFHTVDTTSGSERSSGAPFMNPYQIMFDGRAVGRKMTIPSGYNIMHRVVDELMAIDRQPENGEESDEPYDEEAQTTHVGMPLEEANHLFHEVTVEMERVEVEEQWERCAEDKHLSAPSSSHPTTIYNGIAVIHNTRIPYVMYSGAKLCMQMKRCPTKLMHVVAEFDHDLTTADEFSTIVTATLGADPFSEKGLNWLQEARSTIQRLKEGNALEGVEVHIHGAAAMTHDVVNAYHQAFVNLIARASVAVMLILMFRFQSPFRLFLSAARYPLIATLAFGLAAMDGAISWLLPATALCSLVGWSASQDILHSRRSLQIGQQEHYYKYKGAVVATGIVVWLVFRSLTMSGSAPTPVLQHWSYIMMTGLLLDTIVVRPVLTSLCRSILYKPAQDYSAIQQPLLYPARRLVSDHRSFSSLKEYP